MNDVALDASPGAPATATAAATTRSEGLDALRGAATLLVVLHHTAIAYGGSGGWFLREFQSDGSVPSLVLTFFCAVNQAFFMGLFFLLAGYFTPGAIARKGPARFLRDRLLRLGVPLLFFGWILGPFTIALARTAGGEPLWSSLLALWRQGRFAIGPLWFCLALLLFSLAALAWARWALAWARRGGAAPSQRMLLATALATGAAAFVLRLWWPVGTEWLSLQLGYFASYVLLFAAGCHAARTRWLEAPPADRVRRWRRVAWVALPVLPVLALLGEQLPWLRGAVEGGWSLPALAYAFWEPLVAWGILLALLARCQQPLPAAGWWRALADRAYAIFVLHPPVVVGVTLLLWPLPAPALVKFVLAGVASCGACFVLAGWLLRVPGVRRVL